MTFLVDNQFPPALARFLASKGLAASHVADIGMDEATDKEVWNHAVTHRMVLVSKDDALDLGVAWQLPETKTLGRLLRSVAPVAHRLAMWRPHHRTLLKPGQINADDGPTQVILPVPNHNRVTGVALGGMGTDAFFAFSGNKIWKRKVHHHALGSFSPWMKVTGTKF